MTSTWLRAEHVTYARSPVSENTIPCGSAPTRIVRVIWDRRMSYTVTLEVTRSTIQSSSERGRSFTAVSPGPVGMSKRRVPETVLNAVTRSPSWLVMKKYFRTGAKWIGSIGATPYIREASADVVERNRRVGDLTLERSGKRGGGEKSLAEEGLSHRGGDLWTNVGAGERGGPATA